MLEKEMNNLGIIWSFSSFNICLNMLTQPLDYWVLNQCWHHSHLELWAMQFLVAENWPVCWRLFSVCDTCQYPVVPILCLCLGIMTILEPCNRDTFINRGTTILKSLLLIEPLQSLSHSGKYIWHVLSRKNRLNRKGRNYFSELHWNWSVSDSKK